MHAYLLIAHTNQSQVENLLRLLDHPENDIYIHCDSKWSAVDCEKMRGCVSRAGVFFTERTDVRWGDVSLTECELLLLGTAAAKHYDYYHLLSGQDLPLKTQDELHAFFAKNRTDKNYIGFSQDRSFAAAQLAYRLDTYHLFPRTNQAFTFADKVSGKLQQAVGLHRMRQDTEYGYGSNWFSINDALAQYVIGRRAEIRRDYRRTFCSDEIFLQTIVLNSPFRDSLYTDASGAASNLRFIRWTEENRNNPYVFREKDYPEIMASGCLFARKFDDRIDAEIIRKITETVSPHT